MKIIVPMAGVGKRMRPHTLTVPKPLLKIAGKPIVQRLVEDIVALSTEKVEEIAYVIGDFGEEVENELRTIADDLDAKSSIYYQDEALGTAHAILCAKEALKGKVIIGFADTLFKADFKLNEEDDGVIWVKKVNDPTSFGVVKVNEQDHITDFVEKPEEYVSDLAIIGVYYFKNGEFLKDELQYLIDNDIKDKGEYQLTNAMENMKQKGEKLRPGKVEEWMDCGNKDVTVDTNKKILEYLEKHESEPLISKSVSKDNSIIIPPSYIGENVKLKNSVVGPHVSIDKDTKIENSNLTNTIVGKNSLIKNAVFNNSMIGNHAEISKQADDVSLGDHSKINT